MYIIGHGNVRGIDLDYWKRDVSSHEKCSLLMLKKHKASCEKYKALISKYKALISKYKALISKYKALISKYMPYIWGALHFFEIQQYIRLPNRAFFLTYRQLKKLFCRASFL